MSAGNRQLPAGMEAAFAENVVRPAMLAYADFPSGEVRIWTGIGPLDIMGEIWAGVGDLLGVEDVTETTDSAQNGLAVRLKGIPSDIFTAVTLGDYQNRRAEILFICFDREGVPIGEPYTLFRGLMDSDTVRDTGREVSVTISLESAMSDQLRARAYRYTHEDQQTLFPAGGDSGLEFVAALQSVSLSWGKK